MRRTLVYDIIDSRFRGLGSSVFGSLAQLTHPLARSLTRYTPVERELMTVNKTRQFHSFSPHSAAGEGSQPTFVSEGRSRCRGRLLFGSQTIKTCLES